MADTPLYIPILRERGKWNDYRMGIWGNSFTWFKDRSWETIKHVVLHHSVTNPTNNHQADVDYIAELHRRRGWGGVGYHFIITKDGMVWYVGDISTQRANVADLNHLVIGICLVGDFTKSNPSDDQIISAHDLCKFFIDEMPQLVNVSGWSEGLKGHKELQATQCPGTYWKGVGDSIYERIKNRIPYTPQPQPEPVIDWEKRYNDLRKEKDEEIERLIGEKKTCVASKELLQTKLADNEAECQAEITALNELLENAFSQNPAIPTLADFTTGTIIDELIKRIFSMFKKI